MFFFIGLILILSTNCSKNKDQIYAPCECDTIKKYIENHTIDMNNFVSGGFVETPVLVNWSSNTCYNAKRVLQVYHDSQLIYPDKNNPNYAQCPNVKIHLDTGYYEFKLWVPNDSKPEKTCWVHIVDTLKYFSGANLVNWEIVVGDGNYNAPAEPPVNIEDITTLHYSDCSELKANIKNRRIMAHNITFNRVYDDSSLAFVHKAGYSFRLPYFPSKSNSDFNGETIEGGLFIWDGNTEQKDLGLAFQWIINPWDVNFKDIRMWNGSEWIKIGSLQTDTLYHSVQFYLNIRNRIASFTLDGNKYQDNFFSETMKTWGTGIAARLQAEIISIYPPTSGTIPSHKVLIKDWYWQWVK